MLNFPSFFNGVSAPYQIEQSLRFRGAQELDLDPTDISITAYTFSAWVKRSTLGSEQMIWSVAGGGPVNWLQFNSDNTIRWFADQPSGGGGGWNQITTGVYRDPSAWMHVFVAVDTTLATQTDRAKLYINGELAPLSTASYPSQNGTLRAGSDYQGVGYSAGYDDKYLDGYLAEVHCVTGTAYDRTDFGEFDDNGVWRPINVSGLTYGTNGFYLTFDPTATNGVGHDHSGNGNNWTPTGFDTTNTTASTYDVMSDTPTTNWCTLNPLDANGGNFFNGNLEYAGPYSSFSSQNGHGCRSTLLVPSSGKWYVEAANVTYSGSGNSCMLGFTSSKQAFTATAFGGNLTPWIGVDASVFNNNIKLYWNGVSGGTTSGTQLFAGCASGDVVNLAIDFDNGKFWVGKNGTWYNSGNPAAGTNPTSTFTAGTDEWAFWGEYVAASDNGNRSSVRVNFGQRDFAYTQPTGFSALNTSNLPAPSIKAGSDYFNTVLWTGTSAENSISTVGFQPDFTWIKGRTNVTNHVLTDAVRGVTKVLESDSTAAEYTNAQSVKSFDTNGFTLGTDNDVNNSTAGYNQYVAWNWLAANGTETNTAGSINSTVSVNPTAGFSIVKWTGTSTAESIGHGLGVTPNWIIHKFLSASNWSVYTTTTGLNDRIKLNSTDGETSDGGVTAVSSTTFSLSAAYNANISDHIAYCFAEVEGYSKFGSYTGNGSSSDGPFVYCGFRPAWVLTKRTDSTSAWYLHDTVRNTYNVANLALSPDLSDAEVSANNNLDILSNGFKLRTSGAWMNASGGTYIFMALAENPFGGSNVSPATAR